MRPRHAGIGVSYSDPAVARIGLGSVRDPQVIDSKPPRVFDREAIRAILRWKFKPRVIDGTAVSRRAVQTIDFNLDQ